MHREEGRYARLGWCAWGWGTGCPVEKGWCALAGGVVCMGEEGRVHRGEGVMCTGLALCVLRCPLWGKSALVLN